MTSVYLKELTQYCIVDVAQRKPAKNGRVRFFKHYFGAIGNRNEEAVSCQSGQAGVAYGVATCLYWVHDPQDARNSIGVLVLTNTNWPEVKNGAPLDIAITVIDCFQGH